MFGKIVLLTSQEAFNYCLKRLAKHSMTIAFTFGAAITSAAITGINAGRIKILEKRVTELENAQKASPEA